MTAARTQSRTKRAKKVNTENAGEVVLQPLPENLERICKGLAALDAMMSEDWESRYYSFNHAWNKTSKERMASMQNGSGDEWFIVFQPAGVFFKAFWHEHPPEDTKKLYDLDAPLKLADLKDDLLEIAY